MLNKKLQDAINAQIEAEMYSSNLYLSAFCWFKEKNLNGCAHFMKLQSKEESEHAEKFMEFVLDRGGKAVIGNIAKPTSDFKSVLDVFKIALKHEETNTQKIHNLYELSLQSKDYPLQTFLHWFISEQVEEEALFTEIIDRCSLAGESGAGLLLLDKELGERK